jgi:Zn-dependent protease
VIIIQDLILALFYMAAGLLDTLLGISRKRYETRVFIKAPRDTVWSTMTAKSIKFEGLVPVELSVERRDGVPPFLSGIIRVGETERPIAYVEELDEPGSAGVMKILPEHTDPAIIAGDDHLIAYSLAPAAGGTTVYLSHELTLKRFRSRILVPLGARQNARRIKSHCEKLAGTGCAPDGSRVRDALTTGLLTYVSFLYLLGWQSAAVLLALIVIHEAGHALAMRSVGQPVRGIYFIPFFGGVAVAAAPHASEAERGFVALMGPGLSLLSTAAFVLLWQGTGEALFAELALVSAILNGLNLAPVLPLDGGQIVDAILSRADPEIARIVNFTCLLGGLGMSLYMEWHILTGLLLLTAPFLVLGSRKPRRAEPISTAGQAWLTAGYLTSIAFYVTVAAAMMR